MGSYPSSAEARKGGELFSDVTKTFSPRTEASVGVVPLERRDSRLDDDGVEEVVDAQLRQLLGQLAEPAAKGDQVSRPVPECQVVHRG